MGVGSGFTGDGTMILPAVSDRGLRRTRTAAHHSRGNGAPRWDGGMSERGERRRPGKLARLVASAAPATRGGSTEGGDSPSGRENDDTVEFEMPYATGPGLVDHRLEPGRRAQETEH